MIAPCEICGNPTKNWGARRFCSQDCWKQWQRENSHPDPATALRKRAYGRWYRMRDRCTNPQNSHWSRYGGRGIYVCERWSDFDTYYQDTGDARIKTHCKNGHEFNDANTHIDRRGWRSCRACSRAKTARQRAARKEAS